MPDVECLEPAIDRNIDGILRAARSIVNEGLGTVKSHELYIVDNTTDESIVIPYDDTNNPLAVNVEFPRRHLFVSREGIIRVGYGRRYDLDEVDVHTWYTRDHGFAEDIGTKRRKQLLSLSAIALGVLESQISKDSRV